MEKWFEAEISIGNILDPRTAVKSLDISGIHHLSKYALIENFLLLATNSRDASMLFFNNKDELREAEDLTRLLGLGLKTQPSFIPDPKGGYYVFLKGFTFATKEKSEEIDGLRMPMPIGEIDAGFQFRPAVHEKIGKTIGYPPCCIRSFAGDYGLLVDPDERTQLQTKDYESKGKTNPDSFYANEFLPCRPNCERAAENGRKYEDSLREQVSDAVADFYRDIKSEHLRDVESGKMVAKKAAGNLKYFA